MDLLLIALLLAAVGAVVVVALGKVGGGLAPVQPDATALDGPVEAPVDLDRARFALALRGYRMDQVDAVLDQARDLLVLKDAEIARLQQLLRVPVTAVQAGPAVAVPDEAPDLFRPSDRRS